MGATWIEPVTASAFLPTRLQAFVEQISPPKAPSANKLLLETLSVEIWQDCRPRTAVVIESVSADSLPKTEYLRKWPETFGDLHLKFGKAGSQRQTRMSKRPRFPGYSRVPWEACPNVGMPG
jgi:hypothetical protein